MQTITETDLRELRELGNGATKFIPTADGTILRLSYLRGMWRVDKIEKGATIPLSARWGGGSDISLPDPS